VRDRELRCIICDTEMPFETPPCADGHEEECPELLCTRCGAAEIVAPVTIRVLLSPGGSRVAPQQRRAA
jgi:hypothetical protein